MPLASWHTWAALWPLLACSTPTPDDAPPAMAPEDPAPIIRDAIVRSGLTLGELGPDCQDVAMGAAADAPLPLWLGLVRESYPDAELMCERRGELRHCSIVMRAEGEGDNPDALFRIALRVDDAGAMVPGSVSCSTSG